MMKFNKEQQEAIDFEGKKILVSAGAGSGKTAVLTERILRKLKSGVSIDELVVITFTRAAAAEMKERIKGKIETEIANGNKKLIPELDKLDAANISTFDSYSLNLLKKYHYELNLSKNIKIGEGVIFKLQTYNIIENYFMNNLDSKLLKYYAVGDKRDLYKVLYNCYNKYCINVDYKFTKSDLTDNYYFLLRKELLNVEDLIRALTFAESEEVVERANEILDVLNSDGEAFFIALTNIIENKILFNRGKVKEKKPYKEQIEKIRSLTTKLVDATLLKSPEELKEVSIITNDIEEEIANILIYIEKHLYQYKLDNSIFDFIDVSKLVIELLESKQNIRDQVKNNINEVLIDEYQDTVSFQDYLVSLITDDNIFMVGDIKQAIYGFRNATPESFNRALNDPNCHKIFLNYNYRSCKSVIEDINVLFRDIMNEFTGGVDYDENQELNYGNTSFDNVVHVGTEYLVYDNPIDKVELEAQLIANDIIKKQKERNLKFKDFAILCRNKTQFDTYAEVLISNGINVNIFSDVTYTKSFEIMLIKSFYELAINPNNKFAKASILRSFLFNYTDEEIAKLIEEPFYDLRKNNVNNYQFYNFLLKEFCIMEKTKFLSDPNDALVRLRFTFDLMQNFDDLNYTFEDVVNFFDEIDELDQDINFSYEKSVDINAVTMMTIHKSKGLEFPIVYMPNLSGKFNTTDVNDHIIFSPKYGLVIKEHFIDDGIMLSQETYKAKMHKLNYVNEMNAEEMRLLYVAMTRAKQDIVFICNEEDLNGEQKSAYLKWLKNKIIDYEIQNGIEDNSVKKTNESNYSKNTIKFLEVESEKLNLIPKISASQLEIKTIDEFQNKMIEEGNRLHLELEYVDFLNLDNSNSELAKKLKVHALFNNIEKYYTEYEYIFNTTHGIIDLLIDNKDEIIIVDYKLKNINKPEYEKQLEHYEEYIKSLNTGKKITKYLYSIIDNELVEIN